AGLSPTSTTAIPGTSACADASRATSPATFLRNAAAMALPSMIRAVMAGFLAGSRELLQQCRKCSGIAGHRQPLDPPRGSGCQRHIAARHAERLGDQRDQCIVGFTLAGRRA